MRAGPRGKVIGAGFARLQHRHRQVGHTVLRVVGNLAMPVDDRRFGRQIVQNDIERITGVELQPAQAVRALELEDGSRPAIHLDGAFVDIQDPMPGLGRSGMAWKNVCMSDTGERGSKQRR